jgi:hypothetical protein
MKQVKPIPMTDEEAANFFSGSWHIQQQTETKYLKKEYNNFVKATYRQQKASLFGYTVGVSNFAESDKGELKESDFFGMPFLGGQRNDQRNDQRNGKAMFLVAPRFLPKWFAGDYWIIAHENKGSADEFAIVCGGQPTILARDYRYTYDTDVTNNSGLWIFTREQNPANVKQIVRLARRMIRRQGISTQGLNDVKQK